MTRSTTRVGVLASALILLGTLAACNKKNDTTLTDTTSLGTTTATVGVSAFASRPAGGRKVSTSSLSGS